MDLRPVLVSLTLLWVFLIVAPPALWYAMQEEPVGIALNTGEEEPGEPSGPDKWEEKIVFSEASPGVSGLWTRKPDTPFTADSHLASHAMEVRVPPPEQATS
ncbi:hypothetical protein [Robiginitalea sediminis]|uniref:hypothetical protein n=1 Tax=Robiginitalea sediminis TaxID=1982593 RepID=UPI000B4B3EF1|nr:hypothetical protein [Robiginitalea sediminis]